MTFAAVVNCLLNVFGEIWIERSCGVFGERRGDLGQLTPARLGGAKHGDRLRVTLYDDFIAGLNAIQYAVHVAREICFADV